MRPRHLVLVPLVVIAAYAEACAKDRRTSLNAQALGAYFAHGSLSLPNGPGGSLE